MAVGKPIDHQLGRVLTERRAGALGTPSAVDLALDDSP
jgi:hypothetical protein